jgi:pilus assembly protein FimV
MFRKLSLALAVSAALWPAGGFALGLGGLVTKSTLNEKFLADIELVAVDPGDLETLKVGLAPAADFARAGVDRPFQLSKLQFKPMQLPDGRAVIRVTTREPVREPFLDFLVEVNWPKGRLVRELTVLLDPPVTRPVPPPAIAVPVVGAPGRVERRAPQPKPHPAAAVSAPSPTMTITGQFGPVPRGATLWGIASDVKAPGASVEQAAMGLFRTNDEAFVAGDINRLKAGVTLRVPSPQDMLAEDRRKARADFLAEARGEHRVSPVPADQLRIAVAPKGQAPGPKGPTPVSTETGQPQPAGGRGAEMERVRTDLMMVRETSESNRQETEELRSRIRELESQLGDIRQLLKLKCRRLRRRPVHPQQQRPGRQRPPGRRMPRRSQGRHRRRVARGRPQGPSQGVLRRSLRPFRLRKRARSRGQWWPRRRSHWSRPLRRCRPPSPMLPLRQSRPQCPSHRRRRRSQGCWIG